MFINSPPLHHNGDILTRDYGRYFYQDGFLTFAAALAYTSAGNSYAGYNGYTYRNNMQNGIVNGKKTITPYNSLRLKMEVSGEYRQIISYREAGVQKWAVLMIRPAFGYQGGDLTGLGDPVHQFIYLSTSGPWTKVANHAIGANALNRAKVEVLSKARNQKLDLSESFVDIDKSVMMIAKRASMVLKAMVEARRGNWPAVWLRLGLDPIKRRNVSSVGDFLSKGWLEASYGWLPLLMDIKAGVDFVNNGLQAGPEGIFSSSRKVTAPMPFCILAEGYPDNWAETSISSEVTHDIKVRYNMRVNNPTMAYLSGIGLDNPAYLAWVGIPFSFVVDWLMPVSPWLQSLTTPLGLTFIDGYISRRTSGSVEIVRKRYFGSTTNRPVVYESPPVKATAQFVELNREVLYSFPTALPYFRLPFSNPKRIVSTVALFNQLRFGRF